MLSYRGKQEIAGRSLFADTAQRDFAKQFELSKLGLTANGQARHTVNVMANQSQTKFYR